MSGSLPTASAGVQFPEAQQVYQNLCCPFVALSFQKPDLVPDLILPGGASPGPVLPQHLVDFSCFWTSALAKTQHIVCVLSLRAEKDPCAYKLHF